MSTPHPSLAFVGVALVGIAAIGVGAAATFTESTSSTQTITAGTLDVSLSSPEIPGCTDASNKCDAVTLPPVGPVGSTFESDPITITLNNTGTIPAFFDAIQISETHGSAAASAALRNQINVCIQGSDPSGTWVEGNGPLWAAIALVPTVKQNPVRLDPGDGDATYAVSFYAGQDSSYCGTTISAGSNTRAAWQAVSGGYVQPASLTNDAMGGVVTPTLTFSFTG